MSAAQSLRSPLFRGDIGRPFLRLVASNRAETMAKNVAKKTRKTKPVAVDAIDDDPFLRRLNDPNEANALWRRLRVLELDAAQRASRTHDHEHVVIAKLIGDARVKEERLEGLPGLPGTVCDLPRVSRENAKEPALADLARAPAIKELLMTCEFHRQNLVQLVNQNHPKYARDARIVAHILLLRTMVLGLTPFVYGEELDKREAKLAKSLSDIVTSKAHRNTAENVASKTLQTMGISSKDAGNWLRLPDRFPHSTPQ